MPQREALKKEYDAGNFKVAYDGYRQLCLDANDDPAHVGEDLGMAAGALQQLAHIDELDDFREATIRIHAKNWRLLWAAAESYLSYENFGFIVAGKFYRGQHRGGGQAVNSLGSRPRSSVATRGRRHAARSRRAGEARRG